MDSQRPTIRRHVDRRKPADRRLPAERRRGSDARIAVFEICRSNLHLALVVRAADGGADKVVTRSIRWRKSSTNLYSDAGRSELTDAFRTLVAEERIAGAKVRLALSGEFCVTRVVTGSNDEVRRECGELEDRSHRYLTLGPGPKVLATSVQQLDARHEHALLTVANQRTLESLLKATESAGLQIEAIEPSLVSLSRAQAHLRDAYEDACLIIQLDESGAELGIAHRQLLLLDYRPGGHTNASNVADILAQHLTRVQRYLDRNHSYLKKPVRRVYLAGEADAVAQATRQFKRFPQFEVSVLDPSQLDTNWQYSSESPGPDMAAALGTALFEDRVGAENRGPNLMERVMAESHKPMRPILFRSLLPIAAAMLVAIGLTVLYCVERGATNLLRAELAELEPLRSHARELQLTINSADAKLAALKRLAGSLPQPNWGRLLMRIAQSMPEDVWLDGMNFTDAKTAVLHGASYADGGVYDFVNFLKQVPDIKEIALQGTGVGQSLSGPTTSFDLQLSLVQAAESNDREVGND